MAITFGFCEFDDTFPWELSLQEFGLRLTYAP